MKAGHLSSLQTLEWGHPQPVSFLNVNNLVFVLVLASILIMLNAISLVHQVHCDSSIWFLCVFLVSFVKFRIWAREGVRHPYWSGFWCWVLQLVNPQRFPWAHLVTRLTATHVYTEFVICSPLLSAVSASQCTHLLNLSTLFIGSYRLCTGSMSGILLPPSSVTAQNLRYHMPQILVVSAILNYLFMLQL
jgi:hypothetical protein